VQTLTEMTKKEITARTRAAYYERFSGNVRDCQERIAALEQQRPNVTVLEKIAELIPEIPKDAHVRPGRFHAGGGIARDLMRHIVMGALEDSGLKNESIDQEIAQLKVKLKQFEDGLARLDAEEKAEAE